MKQLDKGRNRVEIDKREEEILSRAKENDAESMEWILLKYKTLVRQIARRFYFSGEDTDDLVQEGMLALWKAVREYSPQKNAGFSTYASRCIRNKMIDALRSLPKEKCLPLNEVLAADDTEVLAAVAAVLEDPSKRQRISKGHGLN